MTKQQVSQHDRIAAAQRLKAVGIDFTTATVRLESEGWYEAAAEAEMSLPDFVDMQIQEGYFDAPNEEVGGGAVLSQASVQPPPDDKDNSIASKFRILGYSGDKYYYFPFSKSQIVCLTPSAHSIQNLMQLAPLDWWLKYNSGGEDSSMSPSQAALFGANKIMRMATEKGIFDDSEKVRGCGAWMDEGRVILHCGNTLYVDGKKTTFRDINSHYTYVAASKLLVPARAELSNAEAFKLRTLCEMPSWENKLSGSLLAGWLVIAPICAVLDWRPHIWITGQAESGKSTIMDKIVKKVLGDMALCLDGGTTEAAIRAFMRYDARPLVYDEGEGSGKAKHTMEGVMALVRLASSGGQIGKFGQNRFTARFTTCFSAIRPPIREYADETRISLLKLKQNRSASAVSDYQKLLAAIEDTITEDFAGRMLTRILKYLPTLLKNIKTFKKAAHNVIRGARASDQIAPMLAGLYFLHGTGDVTLEKAEEWIKAQDWSFHTTIGDDNDSTRALQHLCSCLIRYQPSNGTPIDVSIGDMISAVLGQNPDIKKEWAYKTLRNNCIIAKNDGVIIANKSQQLEKLFKDTSWSVGWTGAMEAVDGAEKLSSTHFSPGNKQRATKLPISLFIQDDYTPLADNALADAENIDL